MKSFREASGECASRECEGKYRVRGKVQSAQAESARESRECANVKNVNSCVTI